MGKGEIARYEQFLLFPQCFQKAYFPGVSKGVIVWEWVNVVIWTKKKWPLSEETHKVVHSKHHRVLRRFFFFSSCKYCFCTNSLSKRNPRSVIFAIRLQLLAHTYQPSIVFFLVFFHM